MSVDYERISRQNIENYGTRIDRYGPVLLANLYSDRTHFLYELLQNAEDARASWVSINLFRDRLEVIHNGRKFEERDVTDICGLAEGAKAGDLTQIGRFGIGFKSVYAYTRTPEIHCEPEHFRIKHFVRPESIAPKATTPGETLFVFPFDHEEVSPQAAFDALDKRLQELGVGTLLFLHHIERVRWSIERGDSGEYCRNTDDLGWARRVQVASTNDEGSHVERWLILGKAIPGITPEAQRAEVAFRLETTEGGLETIVPIELAPLVVFFPTEKETHLGFLIQGPYQTTPARDNIPKDNEWNKLVIETTGRLVAEAMVKLRDQRLLNVSCLSALPIAQSQFPSDSMFRPIFDAVAEAFSSSRLIPTAGGGFQKAGSVKLARSSVLRELFPPEKLQEVYGAPQSIEWVCDEITETRTPELRRYLIDVLKVEEVTPDDLARRISGDFLKDQPDEWIVRFYQFLGEYEPLWRAGYPSYREGSMRSKPFIRLESGEHAQPFGQDGSPNAYLPPVTDTTFPIVKRTIAADELARDFLQRLGLSEPDIVTEILNHILPKYASEAQRQDIGEDEHVRDLETIVRGLQVDSVERRATLFAALRRTPFLRAVNYGTEYRQFQEPAKIYVASADLSAYFAGNEEAWYLDDLYGDWLDQLRPLGISVSVRLKVKGPSPDGHIATKSDWGDHERGLYGFDQNFTVDGLPHALSHPTIERSKYVWNRLLGPNRAHVAGVVEMSTRQTFEGARREERISISGKIAREQAWLPDKAGQFRAPSQMSLDDLPEGFERDEELATRLGLQSSSLARLAEEAGIEMELLDLVKDHPDEVRKLLERLRNGSAIEESENSEGDEGVEEDAGIEFRASLEAAFSREGRPSDAIEAPSAGPGLDAERRRDRTQEEIATELALGGAKPPRFRRVPRRVWDDKNGLVRAFLSEEYAGKCQICDFTFRKRDGQPYFEGLYLVSRTKSAWTDRPGCVLCLCPTCSAKLQFGSLHAENVTGQIRAFKAVSEGGSGVPMLCVNLCGDDVQIGFSERHMIELQEMLRTVS